MAVIIDEKQRLFTLHTKNSTYQMKAEEHGVLLHLYYGKKMDGDLSYLIQKADVGFSGNPNDLGVDRTFSLDTLPQEFPSCGVGDYRLPCIGIVEHDGSRAVDFRYHSYEVLKGAFKVPGMPSLYEEEGRSKRAETLVIRMKDQATGVELELYYGVWEDEDVISRSARFINEGTGGIVLEKLLSMCLDFQYGNWELVHFHGRHAMERQMERVPLMHGTMSVGSRRGASSHQHNPGVILCEPDAGEAYGSCYGILLVYSGSFTAEAEVDQLGQTRVVMGIHPDQFHYHLSEGESFDTPQVLMTYTDNGFTQISHILHRIIRQNICRGKYKNIRRPILINNWEATYFDFTEDKLLSIARKASELGIEMLVMDDGWFGERDGDWSGLGDWKVNTRKLKGGLENLVRKINDMGMKFGIWFEPEMVSEDSELYRQHPDWALKIPGRGPARSRYQLVLDLSRKEVRDYLYLEISAVLNSANIEYVKWDYNRSMCDIYSAVLPKEKQGEVCHRYMLGLYDLLERLTGDYPEVLFEGCSGGGGRFDAAMLYYSPQIWCSDDTDAIERTEIQYGTSYLYPVSSVGSHVSASPNHQTGRSAPFETRGVVAMAGSFGYELDLNLISEEEKNMVKAQVEQFKRYYEVIHQGDYYRLNSPYDGSSFIAWQFVSKDQRKSLVNLVFTHVRANIPAVYFKLKGLDPDKKYQVEGTDLIYTGSCLLHGGLSVPMIHKDYPSVQIYLVCVS